MTLLPSPLHLAAAAAERVQPTAPGSSPGSSKGLANTGIAAVKMPSEVQLLEQGALLMCALTRNDPFVMVLVATADKAWLDGREDRSPARECAPCGCHHAAGRSSGFAAAGSLNPRRRRRNRPSAPTASPHLSRRICLAGHQLTAAVAWTATRPCPIFRPAPATVGLPRGGDGAWSTVSCMAPSLRFGGGWDLGPAARSHASAGSLS
jgi:hypothetical protein